MAKSLRSKVKRDFRAKKREQGVYAATEAARLHRLNSKLKAIVDAEKPEREQQEEDEDLSSAEAGNATLGAPMAVDVDTDTPLKKISTHGRSASRREEWRSSKGMTARGQSRGLNRQGGIAARRNAGRPKRRR